MNSSPFERNAMIGKGEGGVPYPILNDCCKLLFIGTLDLLIWGDFPTAYSPFPAKPQLLNPDRFDVDKFMDALNAQFSAISRTFDSTKG